MSKQTEKKRPVRAIDPDLILKWEHEGVTYSYRQPSGVVAATNQQEHGNMLIDSCLVAVKGLEGAEALRAKGHEWSKLLPQPHANRLYIQLLNASALTEVEAEG